MKYAFALAAAISTVVAQLPACGQQCVENLQSIAQSEFGCSSGDVACYCANMNFGYGLRDCSYQACGAEVGAQVVAYGTTYCAGQSPPGAALTVLSNAAANPTAAGSAATDALGAVITSAASEAGAAESTPVTTSPLEATITSDGSVITTTTGFATLYAPAGAAGSAASQASDAVGSAASSASDVAASATDAAGSAVSSAEGAASSVASDASAAASSVASDASAAVSSVASAANSAANSATGAAPIITAAPMLAGAGLAAMLLI